MMLLDLQNKISAKAFLQGLAGVGVFYIFVLLGALFNNSDVTAEMESRLATVHVKVGRQSDSIHSDIVLGQEQAVKKEHRTVTFDEIHLTEAPIRGLYEPHKDGGFLPIISPIDGLTPFAAYKQPFEKTGGPVVAVIIEDYGLSKSVSNTILETLPPQVTLILSPYADTPLKWQKKARAKGHEVWMHIPVETENYPQVDGGPYSLLTQNSLKKNKDRLYDVLRLAVGYSGVAMFTDNSFANSSTTMRDFLLDIVKRGLGVIDLNPGSRSIAAETVKTHAGSYGRVNGHSKNMSFKTLERIAQDHGSARIAVSSEPARINALEVWLNTLEAKNIALAPLSATMSMPKAQSMPAEHTLDLPAIEAPSTNHTENENNHNESHNTQHH